MATYWLYMLTRKLNNMVTLVQLFYQEKNSNLRLHLNLFFSLPGVCFISMSSPAAPASKIWTKLLLPPFLHVHLIRTSSKLVIGYHKIISISVHPSAIGPRGTYQRIHCCQRSPRFLRSFISNLSIFALGAQSTLHSAAVWCLKWDGRRIAICQINEHGLCIFRGSEGWCGVRCQADAHHQQQQQPCSKVNWW